MRRAGLLTLALLVGLGAALPAGTARARSNVVRDDEGEPIAVPGQVYVVRDEDGNLVFTDTPDFGAIPVNLRDPPPINPNLNFAEQESKYDALILKAAQKYRVDPFLVKAVIRTESMFDPDAISDAGAQGLMQLIPATAERFHVDDMMDPAKNIDGGVRYLRWLLDLFKGNARLAVAAYNCGEQLVIHEKKVPDIPETQDYVTKVEAARSEYRAKGFSTGATPGTRKALAAPRMPVRAAAAGFGAPAVATQPTIGVGAGAGAGAGIGAVRGAVPPSTRR